MLEVKVIVRGQGYVSGVEVVLPGDECDGLVHVLSGAHNGPPDDSDSGGGSGRWQTTMMMVVIAGGR